MNFADVKKLYDGASVLIKDENHMLRAAVVTAIDIEDKDAFIRCDDGHLYHHTALQLPKKDNGFAK